jgi:small nuclear ribonucleoprotein (snRNP)-like protein
MAEKVVVLTCDSRTLIGMLLSCDQMTNLVCLFWFMTLERCQLEIYGRGGT